MKKTIVLFIVFIASTALAFSPAIKGVLSTTYVAVGGCDTCSGALILTSHFENNDNIETGTPCGCNTNADKTWSRTGATYSSTQKSDGTYALLINGGTQVATITADISKTAGTLIFDIYYDTWSVSLGDIFYSSVDGDNYIAFYTASTEGTAVFEVKAGGTSWNQNITGLTVDTWHTITLKWSVAGVDGYYLYTQIDSESPSASTVSIGTITGTPTTVNFGYGAITPGTYYIDNVKLYNSWQ